MKRSQLLLLAAALAPEIASPDLLGQTLYLLKGAIRPSGSVEPWRSEILRVDEKAGRLSVARFGYRKIRRNLFLPCELRASGHRAWDACLSAHHLYCNQYERCAEFSRIEA